MKQVFPSLWSRLKTRTVLETDSPGERRRKVTLVMIAFFCCLAAVISITWSISSSRPFIEILMPLIFTIIVGIALFTYFVIRRFALLLYPFLIMILGIPVFYQISIGGLSGQGAVPIIFWSILAPFGSLMFQNVRKANWWFLAYLILVFIFLLLDKSFTQFAELPVSFSKLTSSHTDLMISHGITIIVLSIIIFVSMRYFVNAFQTENSRAENLVVNLTQTNKELESTLYELQATQTELVQSEKMASLGKLAAGIAHEINNPIGALKSTAYTSSQCVYKMKEFFRKKEEFAGIRTDPGFQSFLKILKDNSRVFSEVSERVSNTVNSFINFARLDKSGFDSVDIHQSIDDTLTLFQHEIKAQTNIVKEYGDLPRIACYPAELNQVFMNLLSNAAQAIEGEGKITIRTFLKMDKVHIQIADSGVGIPQEQIHTLFDPHFTRDESRVKAGLGLFTSYNIIQKHQGEIKVESEVGKGSVFTIIIPIAPEKVSNN